MYLTECFFHCGSKYDHELSQFRHFFYKFGYICYLSSALACRVESIKMYPEAGEIGLYHNYQRKEYTVSGALYFMNVGDLFYCRIHTISPVLKTWLKDLQSISKCQCLRTSIFLFVARRGIMSLVYYNWEAAISKLQNDYVYKRHEEIDGCFRNMTYFYLT